MEERVRGLFPIYRLSHDAIRTIDNAYRKGWARHYEVTIPTILDQAKTLPKFELHYFQAVAQAHRNHLSNKKNSGIPCAGE